MSPPPDPLLQILYLITYTMAAAGVLLPLVSGRDRKRKQLLYAGRFLQVLSFSGIIPSLQVILNAIGLIRKLPGLWPDLLTLLFNTLILTGLWACGLTWFRLTQVFGTRPFKTEKIRRPVQIAAGGLLILNLTAQSLALLSRQEPAIQAAQYCLILLFLFISLLFLAGTPGLYRPRHNRNSGITALRLIPPSLLLLLVLYILLDYRLGRFVPPLALITLFTLSLRVFLKQIGVQDNPSEIRDLLFREAGLTPREQEIAVLLAEGLSYKEISGRLHISLSTIQTHVSRIYGKTGVNSKTGLSRKIHDPGF